MLEIICYNPREAADAVCALLNGKGGVISCSFPLDIEQLRATIRPIPPPFGSEGTDSGKIKISEGCDKPYASSGRFSVYVDGAVRPAEHDDLAEMLMASTTSPVRWERQFADDIDLDDFDAGEIKLFVNGLHKEANCDYAAELERIGLMRRGRFTNAADVLLCPDVATRQPQTRATAVAFEHKEDPAYAGHIRASGFLMDVFDKLWDFFVKHAMIAQVFDDVNPRREPVYRFPPKAVKEGLVNALAHRDYESYAGGVKLEISRDRLVITNAGELFGGIKVEQLWEGHVFAFRNPDISNYLTIRGFMEMVGRGVLVIREECRKAGLPPPEWESADNHVRLTIFGKSIDEDPIKSDKSPINLEGQPLSVIADYILGEIRMHPGCNRIALVGALGLSLVTVKRAIAELRKDSRIEHRGSNKTGGYYAL